MPFKIFGGKRFCCKWNQRRSTGEREGDQQGGAGGGGLMVVWAKCCSRNMECSLLAQRLVIYKVSKLTGELGVKGIPGQENTPSGRQENTPSERRPTMQYL